MELIRLAGVTVGYHGRAVLPPVDLAIRSGMFLGMIGPNGSGKTTLVRTLLGLLPAIGGQVVIAGERPRFGYVPQREGVDLDFPLQSLEIALMGRYGRIRRGRRPTAADRDATMAALRDVGVAQLSERPFDALSGGQRQRVLIARALAGEPNVLVLDEPTSGMDLPSERSMLDLVASFCERGIAVVMVSHHLGAIADYATELCLLAGRAQPVAIGPRAEMLTSERLSAIYGQPVTVASVEGRAAIFVHGVQPPGTTGQHQAAAPPPTRTERR